MKTDYSHKAFQALVHDLDSYLAVTDGEEHAFYNQFNQIESLEYVLLLFLGKDAVACGAIKQYNSETMEIKRMYVVPNHRNKGLASLVLKKLEEWAKELHYHYCILETGLRQTEAVGLYHKNQYKVIPNYGPYQNAENSICFKKVLK